MGYRATIRWSKTSPVVRRLGVAVKSANRSSGTAWQPGLAIAMVGSRRLVPPAFLKWNSLSLLICFVIATFDLASCTTRRR